jgi:D-alanyl-lipoteichoic acid acyltransferase DltB (MBOAT superfamily)
MAVGGLVYGLLCPPRWRLWALFAASLVGVFALQPALPIRFSDTLLPLLTLGLVAACWWAVRAPGQPVSREDAAAALALLGVCAALMLTRETGLRDLGVVLTASRPPPLLLAAGLAAGATVLFAVLALALRTRPRALCWALIGVLVGVFIAFRAEPLARLLAAGARTAAGQDAALASAIDWNWLGFSYVAFRLIHTLRDRQMGILPALGLRDYVLFAVFFPAYTAGPIDRAERFAADAAALPAQPRADAGRFAEGGWRIARGLFKKFVLADALAAGFALTPTAAAQAESTAGLWLLVYGYALRLFLDFSGYTDIAIGLGILFGVRLPENFAAPYTKTNLAQFWQSWHMTLSAWAKAYLFSPITRAMLRARRWPAWAVTLTGHIITMGVIGLWHGITAGFFLWGLWHAVGLFVHKLWSDRTRAANRRAQAHAWHGRAWSAAGWFATFHFVVLGWVWFALPDPALAVRTLARLFGIGA